MRRNCVIIILIFLTNTLSGQFLNIYHYTDNAQFINSGVHSVGFETVSNQLWVITRQQGIYTFKNQQFTSYPLKSRIYPVPDYNFGLRFLDDENGGLWLLDPNGGLHLTGVHDGQVDLDVFDERESGHVLNSRYNYLFVYMAKPLTSIA